MVRPAPGIGGRCGQQQTYKVLSLKVSIRGQSSTAPLETLEFNNVKVNECSKVLKFTQIPGTVQLALLFSKFMMSSLMGHVDGFPIPVGVRGLSLNLLPIPGDGPNGAGRTLRDGTPVNAKDTCWEIELHLATDDTKDIPR